MEHDQADGQETASLWMQKGLPYLEGTLTVLLLVLFNNRLGNAIEDRAWLSLLQIGTCYGVWRGGLLPGLWTLGVATLAGTYLYVPPKFSFWIRTPADATSVLIFIALGLVIVGFGAAHFSERQRILDRDRSLLDSNRKLRASNIRLFTTLHRRNEALQEIRHWAAEEMR